MTTKSESSPDAPLPPPQARMPLCATCGRTADWKYHNVLNHGEDSHKFVALPTNEVSHPPGCMKCRSNHSRKILVNGVRP